MKSGVGAILRLLGLVFFLLYLVAGIAFGSAFGSGPNGTDFNMSIAIGIWFIGSTVSALIIAIGTIVGQLNGLKDIQKSLDRINKSLMHETNPQEINQNNIYKTESASIDIPHSGGDAVNGYYVDRSQVILECPNCGYEQKSDRGMCYQCGVKFL